MTKCFTILNYFYNLTIFIVFGSQIHLT